MPVPVPTPPPQFLRIQLRRGTSAQWAQRNPVLMEGEPGFDTDVHVLKIGDGVTPWLSLPTFSHQESATPTVAGTASTHTQSTPAAQWRIDHNLGRPIEPIILLDSDPTVPILTDVEHPSLGTTVVTFPSPVTGRAYYS